MKIFINEINESWIVDRFRNEWYENNPEISTDKIKEANIIWIMSPWTWNKISKKQLKQKKVICTIHHIDFENFKKKEFIKLDKYVDFYHVISKKTEEQVRELTNKKIICIPFWFNPKIWHEITNKDSLRKSFGLEKNDYLIGSFQRDTEGKDLKSPKLIKGPDIFLDIVKDIYRSNKNLKVVLTGYRRNYLIKNFEVAKIPYVYFEMVDLEMLNKLYNILDLYVVASRNEGGPQAILECAASKTPIVSTDVGIASQILSEKSIYSPDKFHYAIPDTDYAYRESLNFKLPKGMKPFRKMFIEST